MLDIYQSSLSAIILGLIQGFTELLPISSSGHLMIAGKYLHFPHHQHGVFFLAVQLASTFAIMLFYRKRLAQLLRGFFFDAKERHFFFSLLLAFIPAALIGKLLDHFTNQNFVSLQLIAYMLILGGVVILFSEHFIFRRKNFFLAHTYDTLPLSTSLIVGLGQSVSLIPGVSRSGSTILSAMFCRVSRRAAVEFSFIVSIPISLAASCARLYGQEGAVHLLTREEVRLIFLGSLASFLIAFLACRLVIGYVKEHTLNIFGWWRILFGTGILLSLSTL